MASLAEWSQSPSWSSSVSLGVVTLILGKELTRSVTTSMVVRSPTLRCFVLTWYSSLGRLARLPGLAMAAVTVPLTVAWIWRTASWMLGPGCPPLSQHWKRERIVVASWKSLRGGSAGPAVRDEARALCC